MANIIKRHQSVFILSALLAGSVAMAAVYTSQVRLVDDGDTFRLEFGQEVLGHGTVRILGIDSPENGQTGPWPEAAKNELAALLPAGSGVTLETDMEEVDGSGRVLAYTTNHAGVLVEQDQLSKGLAVIYAIWPNMQTRFEEFRSYQISARQANLGMWPDVKSGAMKLPYEWRDKKPKMYTGDYFTGKFVPPADYQKVHVNNRVFFFNEADARTAGYDLCQKVIAGYDRRGNPIYNYDPACFSSSGE